MAGETSSYEPAPVRTPLILLEERKLDPTLSQTTVPAKTPSECWWIRGNVDLAATKHLGFDAWVQKRDDLPGLKNLLQYTTRAGQRWIILTAYPTWSEYKADAENDYALSVDFHTRSQLFSLCEGF